MKLALFQPVFRIRFRIRIQVLSGSGSGLSFWLDQDPDSMNMYPKKTDWNIGRNNLMVPIAELFKIRIEIASYSTCSELLKNRI